MSDLHFEIFLQVVVFFQQLFMVVFEVVAKLSK